MPLPDSDRAIDILDTDIAAILETNVDPITDAFMNDRRDADSTRLREGFQSRRNVDAIAIDVVVFNDDVAEIDADTEHDGRRTRGFIRQRGAGLLHRKCTVYSVDHAPKLDDGAIADQLNDAAVVGSDSWVKDGLSELL